LSTSAFEARYDNALSSVLQFRQREGNRERFQGNIRLSATELATTFEGPITKKTTFIASARRSYLQTLFALFDLPIRPNFWDFQYKINHRINDKTTLTAIGVGAIDVFSFAKTRNSTPENEFLIRSIPSIRQNSYTVGFVLKRLLNNGYMNIAVSRNYFQNAQDQFEDARNGDENFRNLKLRSSEIENKVRFDIQKKVGDWKWSAGAVVQYVTFDNSIYNRIRPAIVNDSGQVVQAALIVDSKAVLNFWRYGAFAQISRAFFAERLGVSLGVRSDMNTFLNRGNQPLETFSPRLSLSYALTEKWKINASVGRYFKMPIYTVLGLQDGQGGWANRDNRYIQSTHYVAGFEFKPRSSTRFTLEGFFKQYDRYPVSLRNGISIANEGGNFGFVGNERVASIGKGEAYGAEFFFQQKLTTSIYAVLSYTYVISRFSGVNGVLAPSAWDNRNLVSALFGKKFGKGWELGAKFRFSGGAPYTPYDSTLSRLNYAVTGRGVLDYKLLNTLRLPSFQQFDIRVDKKWNFSRSTIDVFIDIQNLFLAKAYSYPDYTFKRNTTNTGFATTDGQPLRPDGSNAIPVILPNSSLSVTPSIGFILEF
jgi:hypothetical protein